MHLRTFEHRHAESILAANHRLKKEIERTLTDLDLDFTSTGFADRNRPHQLTQHAFLRHGWRTEWLVSKRTSHRQYFDLYKDRVAIEIEFSNRELLYRDYIRFLLAESEGSLDVGIIIVPDPGRRAAQPQPRNGRPHLEDITDDLNSLRNTILVPIWVIALS